MLNGLILENFKPFGGRQVIPLAPITLIFGANSSGKSSILQALLLLKQTLAEARSSQTLLLPKGSLVDLGSYDDLIFRHDRALPCEITPLFRVDDELAAVLQGALLAAARPATIGLGVQARYDDAQHEIVPIGLPVYWEQTDPAAYAITPATKSSAEEGRATQTAAPQPLALEIASGHPLWKALHTELWETTRPQRLETVERLLALGRDSTPGPLRAAAAPHHSDSAAPGPGDAWPEQPGRAWRAILQRLVPRGDLAEADDATLQAAAQTGLQSLERLRERYSSSAPDEFMQQVAELNSAPRLELRNFLVEQRPEGPESAPAALDDPAAHVLSSADGTRGVPDLGALSDLLASHCRKLLENCIYLGPMREMPRRFYAFGGATPWQVGKHGGLMPDVLYRRPDILQRVNQLLEVFDLGHSIKVHRFEDAVAHDLYSLQATDPPDGTAAPPDGLKRTEQPLEVSLADVGFGVSQVLPVLVESLLAERSLILIEQPELHLHPGLQAELGTVLRDNIQGEYGNQFIVETHSEHLILRLQRLIRKGDLRASDLSVIHVSRRGSESYHRSLDIDEDGDFIDSWPDGFFEEGFRERYSL